ncbi:MAG: carbohydrate ABC transporter permease [Paenibacillus macerans]|uniref:ABC transporter permease subunit n=1 Tax=Paenibacillus macerans TaxID=44252 RepID=A0A090ZAN3_PAEMA|nr:carbohydrate ABC transporter permease [Paenibacillus macerans]KFN07677.1 binding--dependent transport system inner membrane component family protein [Paenibacillus macerans]MBS5913548.1 carbohydrate ABC transporter permease [Paenibacillus macerans]MCY7559585.1 carbohydrate ABC transporter permease [Paenibacillus macerans]MDU5945761.1 carbohydrate ABC transporter permease [Paenibacillus macerans]MDU7474101.1 carbohydrate ABC transporter permease [Paenibacillus macerans]
MKRRSNRTWAVLTYVPAVTWAIISLAPLLWILMLSLKPQIEWNSFPPTLFPKDPTGSNYMSAAVNSPIVTYFTNSLIVTGVSLILSLLVGSLAGYALGRLSFPFRNAIFMAIFSVRMIPALLTVIPLYVLMHSLGLLDSLAGIILVYTATGIPMVIFVMKDFLEGLSKEIEEAAMIDGCSRMRIFFTILLPLVRPGLAAAAILVFVRTWNEFLIALTLTSSDGMRTIPVGLRSALGERMGEIGPMAAYTIIAIVPIIILFLFFQKHFVGGLSQGSSK